MQRTLQNFCPFSQVSDFIDLALEEHSMTNSKHILFMMGQDFAFMAAQINYKNMDSLIENANKLTDETGVHLLYSTPMCYLDAVNRDHGQEEWSTVTTDFFPYKNSKTSANVKINC